MATTLSTQPLSGAAAWSFIVREATQLGLDPSAVLAVASHEGAGGGIGDSGSSYGPFQLHKGGQYPSAAPQDPVQANAWAWSPQGIDYALRGMVAAGAAGQRGPAAITTIVNNFENPTDKPSEIAAADQAYGNVTPAQLAGPQAPATSSGRDVILGANGQPLPGSGGSSLDFIPGIGAVSAVESVGRFLGKLVDPSFWLRALQVLGGGALVGGGLLLLVRQVALSDPASSSPTFVPVPV